MALALGGTWREFSGGHRASRMPFDTRRLLVMGILLLVGGGADALASDDAPASLFGGNVPPRSWRRGRFDPWRR